MYQGTTPVYFLTIPDYDLSGDKVFVTLSTLDYKLTLPNDRLDVSYGQNEDESYSTLIAFRLSQAETLKFKAYKKVDVQVRGINFENQAVITEIKQIDVKPALYKKVIEYQSGEEVQP